MKLFVLFGQRKCDYPGQYDIEALECIDENADSDNPEYLIDKLKEYTDSKEFDALEIVPLEFSASEVRKILMRDIQPIRASVVTE